MLTKSDLSLYLQKNGAPAPASQIHLRSNRGSAVDLISPSAGVTTDAAGKASASVSTRAQPGSSTIDASDPGINTTTPAVITWLPAKYEKPFLVTCYPIADEAAAAAAPVSTQVCGLPPQNTYRTAFIADTKMQGSGKALDGTIIHYKGKGCFNTDTCARTASTECAVAGTTIAVDPTVIPFLGTVNVAIIGQRLAQDKGQKIKGYHIDEFVGPQGPLCKQLGLRHSAISFEKY